MHLHIVFVSYVTLSVTPAFLLLSVGGRLWHHLTVIILLHMFYVLLFWTSIKRGRQSRRESERQYQWPLVDTIRKNRKKNRNIWLWLGCCCLLPTCCLHWPFTSVTVQVPLRCSTTTVQVWQYKYHHCCSTTTVSLLPFNYHSPNAFELPSPNAFQLPQNRYHTTSITSTIQLPQYK